MKGDSQSKMQEESQIVLQNCMKQTLTYLIQILPPTKPTNLHRKMTVMMILTTLPSHLNKTILCW